MISKELLSEVLGEDIFQIEYNKYTHDVTYNKSKGNFPNYGHINIHELAHTCKEWADKLGYEILSGLGYAVIIDFHAGTDAYGSPLIKDIEFENNTEPESVFKACEWLLEKD